MRVCWCCQMRFSVVISAFNGLGAVQRADKTFDFAKPERGSCRYKGYNRFLAV